MPFCIEQSILDLEVSIGIAGAEPGEDALTLVRHADAAMYEAKANKLGWVYYGEDLAVDRSSRYQLLGALRRALEHDEILLHYQPKTSVADGRVVGVEALARWQHPSRGLLGPAEFLPLLEDTTLSFRFTAHVLATALRQTRTWLDQGIRLPVAVNVSTRCLLNPRFAETVARGLVTHGVPGELLCIEITENTVMADPVHAIQTLRRVREMGVRTSVDDFGTGYSSMTYLKVLPVDEIKIDRSFVTQLATDRVDHALVRSTIELGHNLGLIVVAEGVEDAAALAELGRLGCDVAQGYYFARPLPPGEFSDWYGAWTPSAVALVPAPR